MGYFSNISRFTSQPEKMSRIGLPSLNSRISNILITIFRISFYVYALSVIYTRSCNAGVISSSYLTAINRAPTL